MSAIPTQFGPYKLEYALGTGGAGSVFAARHDLLGRMVAVKVLRTPTPSAKARLLREARTQAALNHPNVVTVHDVIEYGDDIAVVMDLVEGGDLALWMIAKPSWSARLSVFRQLLAGVAAAHRRGLVHRDLKPQNVMVDLSNGPPVARVADFGLVSVVDETSPRITYAGVVMGTPSYMAPEQMRDPTTVDERADIFALGCILYELACGRMAFPQTDIARLAIATDSENYPDPQSLVPNLQPEVVRLIQDCLRADRNLRPDSCEQMVARLEGLQLPISVPSGGPATVLEWVERPDTQVQRKPVSSQTIVPSPRHYGRWLALGGVVFISFAGVIGALLAWWPAPSDTSGTLAHTSTAIIPSTVADAGLEPAGTVPAPVSPVVTIPTQTPITANNGPSIVIEKPPPTAEAPTELPAAVPTEVEPPVQKPAAVPTAVEPSVQKTAAKDLGRVTFDGDATEVWLQTETGKRFRGPEVPVGSYAVWATFAGDPAKPKGSVQVEAGRTTKVRCQSGFNVCLKQE